MSMTPIDSVTARAANPTHPSRRYAIVGIASLIGTTIEWYDFFVYGTAAALVFNKIFFPAFDPITGTLAAFGTYAVGFFARPIGAIVFGHFGDKVGRKSMLLLTLIMMGTPTVLIGLVPTYEKIGYWAAVILVLMRLVQGLAIGGEYGGAVLMAVEHAPKGKKGFFGSLPQAGVAFGLVLSSLAMAAVAKLPQQTMLDWGWRVPFWASIALLSVGWFIRLKVAESPDFEKAKKRGEQVNAPVLHVVKHHKRELLTVAGARLAEVTWFYTVATFSLSYATQHLHIASSLILNAVIWGAAAALITIPIAGWLGDRSQHRFMFGLGCVGICIFAFVFFGLLGGSGSSSIYIAMLVALAGVYALLYGPEGNLFSAQFPAPVRYSGISLAVQTSGAIGGGLAPMIATWLVKAGNGSPIYLSWYLCVLGLIALLSVSLMRKDEA
ncbi:Permeases of the major facilitator superfamily [Paraburkholderia caribensis MBA4]|uniref:Permeases of the major facilitator superfamily n=2 Tax=Paraburkholderia caribensis TaxID=75105 RepID=A0A0P0RHZ9_9BURK|nr:MFS transporter [Paraburkholderia caribensis]ALL68323.1 Permeases of the major facilitator superfamily [Paraburkholderia caribensis MBA4]